MGDVTNVDFSGKTQLPDEMKEMLRKHFSTILNEAGFHKTVTEKASMHLTEQTLRYVNEIGPYTSFAVNVSVDASLDKRALGRAIHDQLCEQFKTHLTAMTTAAKANICAAATGACVVMANSDRLK